MCENNAMIIKMSGFAAKIHMRRLLFAGLAVLTIAASACSHSEEKMDAISKSGYVIFNGKKYKVKKIDRPNEAVFYLAPDGVPIPVSLDLVEPAEGP